MEIMTKDFKFIQITEGFIVVNKEGAIYTGNTRNGKNGFSFNPKDFKVYSTEGLARASSPYQEAKWRHNEDSFRIIKVHWSTLDINN